MIHNPAPPTRLADRLCTLAGWLDFHKALPVGSIGLTNQGAYSVVYVDSSDDVQAWANVLHAEVDRTEDLGAVPFVEYRTRGFVDAAKEYVVGVVFADMQEGRELADRAEAARLDREAARAMTTDAETAA